MALGIVRQTTDCPNQRPPLGFENAFLKQPPAALHHGPMGMTEDVLGDLVEAEVRGRLGIMIAFSQGVFTSGYGVLNIKAPLLSRAADGGNIRTGEKPLAHPETEGRRVSGGDSR